MSDLKHTTPGPWIVTTNTIKGSPDRRMMICVASGNKLNKIVALTGAEGETDENESIANAALIAIAPDMLDILITIQTTLPDVLDYQAINAMISDVFAKLANEAGEEL